MITHQYESDIASDKAADECRARGFERARKREERLIVGAFIAIFGCAEIFLLLALAYR